MTIWSTAFSSDASVAQTAAVSGEMKDLVGRNHPLSFKQVNEGEAIYYLAQFPISQQEMLRFTISLSGADGVVRSFDFNQEMFPDQ